MNKNTPGLSAGPVRKVGAVPVTISLLFVVGNEFHQRLIAGGIFENPLIFG